MDDSAVEDLIETRLSGLSEKTAGPVRSIGLRRLSKSETFTAQAGVDASNRRQEDLTPSLKVLPKS